MGTAYYEIWNNNVDAAILTSEFAPRYVQLAEALGRTPSLKELGKDKFERRAKHVVDKDLDKAWQRFTIVIEELAPTQSSG